MGYAGRYSSPFVDFGTLLAYKGVVMKKRNTHDEIRDAIWRRRMIKKICFLAVCVLMLGYASMAYANIFLDFDSPTYSNDNNSYDGNPGDYSHTLTTSWGTITYNGRIWKKLAGSGLSDHTTGNGYFLKNTTAVNKVTMTFSFDVSSIDFYWLGISGVNMSVAVYDENTNLLGNFGSAGSGKWAPISFGGYSKPIRSFAFFAYGVSNPGNKMAVDDITITPVPEPTTLLLLGSGLLGLLGTVGVKRKKEERFK